MENDEDNKINNDEISPCITRTKRLEFMKEALLMAEEAYAVAEVPVGCVFVKGDQIVGRGRNETNETKNGTRHAEMVAIDRMLAAESGSGSDGGGFRLEDFGQTDLYVTVEPCIMCAAALRLVGVRSVYYGCANERFGGCESVLHLDSDERIAGSPYHSEGGYYKDEAVLYLRKFYIRENTAAPAPRRKSARVLKTQDLDISES
ncbi:tRNA(adenine34) deaminase [Coemansia sp. RSA 2049]|nr:tRNA(adenine34) deaminase [Coemansia sp. RSA 2049]